MFKHARKGLSQVPLHSLTELIGFLLLLSVVYCLLEFVCKQLEREIERERERETLSCPSLSLLTMVTGEWL